MERIRKIWQKDIQSIGKYLRVIFIAQVHSRFDASKSVARSPAALRGFWGGPCQFHNSWNMLEHATSSTDFHSVLRCVKFHGASKDHCFNVRQTCTEQGAVITHGLHGWHGSPKLFRACFITPSKLTCAGQQRPTWWGLDSHYQNAMQNTNRTQKDLQKDIRQKTCKYTKGYVTYTYLIYIYMFDYKYSI